MVAGGDADPVLYRYSYLDSPAWHCTDDDGITKRDYKDLVGVARLRPRVAVADSGCHGLLVGNVA